MFKPAEVKIAIVYSYLWREGLNRNILLLLLLWLARVVFKHMIIEFNECNYNIIVFIKSNDLYWEINELFKSIVSCK